MSWEDMEVEEVSIPLDDLFSDVEEQISEGGEFPKENNFSPTNIKRITAGRVVAMVFVGILVSFALFLLVTSLYTNYIRFPKEQERVWEDSRLYALQEFERQVHALNGVGDVGYLIKESSYANQNKDREGFMSCVAGTVGYEVGVVNKKNVYGNDFIDKNTGSTVSEPSWLSEGEEVVLSYVDYSAIVFDEATVKGLVAMVGLTSDDIDYRNKLTDLFCQYIYGVGSKNLPRVSVTVVPHFDSNGSGFSVALEEDILLDTALYSSHELIECFERFAEVVAKVTGVRLTVSAEYRDWEKLSDLNKEATLAPPKYGKHSIGRLWCGAYHLLNEYSASEKVSPQLGDGSKEQPASIGTPVITSVIQVGANGEEVKYPIRITLVEFGVSQKALDWFQAKNIQNRGYDVSSELQYCYCVFEITNLSSETITVTDNMALSDAKANCSGRTGTIYGLQSSVVLEPEETGIIETWGRSTELNLKYVIWGADFARREEPVWFRVLAGDLEDPTWEKGVYINNTRED